MALPSSGEIKMGGVGTNSIAQEKAGTTTGTPTAVSNVSLRGLSVDSVTDFVSGAANIDITGTPDGNAPYAMSEFHGYSQFSWGTPNNTVGGGTPFNINFASQFNGTSASTNAGQRDIATSCDIRLETSGPRVSFFLSRSGDGLNLVSTSQGQVSYSGTLNKIEVRFVYSNVDLSAAENGGLAIISEAYSNAATSNTQLGHSDVGSNQYSVTGADTTVLLASTGVVPVTDREGTDVSWNGAWIDFGATNNVHKSAMIYCSADGTSGSLGAIARFASGGDGTVSLQLRANQDNNSIVTLWTKAAGSWAMTADSEDDESS